jgi:hypothetical protein
VPASSGVANSTAGTYGSGALNTRLAGGTAGVSSQGGQSVFTSSVAPSPGRVTHRAHAHSRSAPVHATAPSPRTATGDVWSGFAAGAKSPVAAAASYPGAQGGGLSSQVLAGILVLGLGVTGLCGGALAVTTSRRRRASAARTTRAHDKAN